MSDELQSVYRQQHRGEQLESIGGTDDNCAAQAGEQLGRCSTTDRRQVGRLQQQVPYVTHFPPPPPPPPPRLREAKRMVTTNTETEVMSGRVDCGKAAASIWTSISPDCERHVHCQTNTEYDFVERQQDHGCRRLLARARVLRLRNDQTPASVDSDAHREHQSGAHGCFRSASSALPFPASPARRRPSDQPSSTGTFGFSTADRTPAEGPCGPPTSTVTISDGGPFGGDRTAAVAARLADWSASSQPSVTLPRWSSSMKSDLRDIRRLLQAYWIRRAAKDAEARNHREWRLVARVLDRLFFFLYCAAVAFGLAALFPRITI